jgi:Protein of unknown function (DUF3187)
MRQLGLAVSPFMVVAALAAALAAPAPAAPGDGEGYSLMGPLRERDMWPIGLTQLAMVPLESSAALGPGWTFETVLTHSNTFAKTSGVESYLEHRGGGREPVTAADVRAMLRRPGDLLYVDGEFGVFAATAHYQASPRLSFFASLPVYYFTGGAFDRTIEAFHRTFGFGQDDRNLVTRDQFWEVYRVGGQTVVVRGAPDGGAGDPILGARYRLLPLASHWDLIAGGAIKVAMHDAGALSTGGSDVGIQLALHRAFDRQAVYLDVSAVHLGGPQPDPTVDRHTLPAYVFAYELGLTHHSSAVAQIYISPSAFSHSEVADLTVPRYEVLAGFRQRHGASVWFFDLIENFLHNDNTPDVGVQLGVTFRLGR